MINTTILQRVCVVLASLLMLSACEFVGTGSGESNNIDWVDTCGSDAYSIGEAGKFVIQKHSLDWDFKSGDMWQHDAPIQLELPEDLVGLVVTLDDHGRKPGLYEARLDGQLVSAAYDSADDPDREPRLSKSVALWSDTLSVGMPSNAKTRLSERRCVELDFVALGANTGGIPDLYFTSLTRANGELGNRLDIQARIVDGAIEPEEIGRLNSELQKTFANACANPARCITPGFVDHFVRLSTSDGGGELDVNDESDDALYKEISALSCKNGDIEGIDCEDAERGINIVFVDGLYLDGIGEGLMLAGLAGGIPMVPFDGTASSSLFISMDAHRTPNGEIIIPWLADTIAHELGHALGLFHTTEQQGEEFDAIADTPECDEKIYGTDTTGRVSAERCKDAGASNLMFWEMSPWPAQITEEQMMVLRSHPLIYRENE